MIAPALGLVGKKGRVVITALGSAEQETASVSLLELTRYEKQIRGALFGSASAQHDIPRLLEMHNLGMLKLDELVTREYRLEDVNAGYEDTRAGRNLRSLIRYE